MSRVFGVDFRDSHVRVASLRTGYRKLEFEGFAEEVLADFDSAALALQACVSKLPNGTADAIVCSVPGESVFSHRLTLPESARKRMSELLPFEIEAVLPLDLNQVVVDYALVTHESSGKGRELTVLTCAATIAQVERVLELVKAGTSHQPERIGVSSSELGQLAHVLPELAEQEACAILDFGYSGIDICILRRGETVMLRTLSGGVAAFPDGATASINALRQTLAAYTASSAVAVARIYLAGEGAFMADLPTFLNAQLELEVHALPSLTMSGMAQYDAERVPLFGRALGAALHGVRGKGLDLRQGSLSFERGYQHLKAKAPLSMALLAGVLVSFLFSVWAESRALSADNEALLASLQLVTQSTFGKSTSDPDEAQIELDKARKIRSEDPMPYLDGLGISIVLAEVLPKDLTHDVEEFDFDQGKDGTKSKLKIRGQVGSAEAAQKVALLLNEHRCVEEAKVTKITQVVNSESERYVLDALVSCPEDSSSLNSKKNKAGAKK